MALIEGAVGVEHFTRRYLDDPAIRALMARVEVVVDPEIAARFPTAWSCRVEVETRDGQRDVETVLSARGDPKNPLTEAEVRDKFHTLTRDVVDADVVKRICEMVDGLERLPSVVPLAALLREAGRARERTA